MAKNMSFKSISFSRVSKEFEAQSDKFKKEVSYLPVRSKDEDRLTQLSYLKNETSCLQAVFRAELIKTCTMTEIKKHLEDIKILLEDENPNQVFKISCHPQSDAMTKSSHFHLWGDVTPGMERALESYLINNKLTVAKEVNITAVGRGELRKVDLNEEGNEEFKKVTFDKKHGHFVVDYKKNEIKSFNATESVPLEKIDTHEKEEINKDFRAEFELIDRETSDYLDDLVNKANLDLEDIIESEDFQNFTRTCEHSFQILNQNFEDFLMNFEEEFENVKKEVTKSLNLKEV